MVAFGIQARQIVRSLDFSGRVAAAWAAQALQIQFIARESDDRQLAVTVRGKRFLLRAREALRRKEIGIAYSRRLPDGRSRLRTTDAGRAHYHSMLELPAIQPGHGSYQGTRRPLDIRVAGIGADG